MKPNVPEKRLHEAGCSLTYDCLGKKLSDKIGALVKHAFSRGIKKRDVGVKSASEIIDVIKENLNCETSNFKNFIIKEVGDGPFG